MGTSARLSILEPRDQQHRHHENCVFTDARFYSCCKNYLYLWTHMATKSMCEAVVEGMGGVWDRCDRQGNWVTATELLRRL